MEINILLGMLEGKYSYDEYHLRTFEILKKGKVPKELNIFYEIQKFNKNNLGGKSEISMKLIKRTLKEK